MMVIKKALLVILALLLIAIWLRNLALLVSEDTESVAAATIQKKTSLSSSPHDSVNEITFNFDAGRRDPFVRPRQRERTKVHSAPSTPDPKSAPSLRASLLGRVWDAKSPYIIVFDSMINQSRVFRVGDTLNGFLLARITASEVRWKSGKGRLLVWKNDYQIVQ
jgi:hypothetical protein